MIGFHLQGNVNDWTEAAARLPDYAPIKFTDGGPQRAVEAKAINPSLFTVVRYVVQEQNPQGDFHQHARDFFAMFVDDTFRTHAHAVDAVCEYNEYFANSQNQEERDKWVRWATAAFEVWRDDYRTQPEYAHIKLILAETAVGNDIPSQLAKLSHQNHWVLLGYHAYVPIWQSQIRPDEWNYYSGRWETMDARFSSMGYTNVKWFLGEYGAVGHNGPGWPNSLAPNDGWRHPDVYNKNINDYTDMMIYWMDKAVRSWAYKEGRYYGATIFTSGGGSRWEHFELAQPDMNTVADVVKEHTVNPPPPPPPPPPPCRGEPRTQYHREYLTVPQDATLEQWLSVCRVAYQQKNTVGFSYDDAGVGDLDRRTAVLYDLSADQISVMSDWYHTFYPGVELIFREYPDPNYPFNFKSAPCYMGNITQEYNYPTHKGIDFGLNTGDPIYAAAAGHIVTVNENPDASPFGKYLIIRHDQHHTTLYAHCDFIIIQAGNAVAAGDHIAGAGSTGNSTGPHLHFKLEIDDHPVDPWPYLEPLS